jgi:hypothetical protein
VRNYVKSFSYVKIYRIGLSLNTNRRNRIKVCNQIGCNEIEFAETMLRGSQSVLKEIIQMVVNDEFKYFGKIINHRSRSVITNNGTVAFF